jgi:hypothetical protein
VAWDVAPGLKALAVALAAFHRAQVRRPVAVAAACRPLQVRREAAAVAAAETPHALAGPEAQVALPASLALPVVQAARAARH